MTVREWKILDGEKREGQGDMVPVAKADSKVGRIRKNRKLKLQSRDSSPILQINEFALSELVFINVRSAAVSVLRLPHTPLRWCHLYLV